MARVDPRATIDLALRLTLSEVEARALLAITEYGDKAFLETFYERIGTSALKPHEDGIRSLFAAVREVMPPVLARTDEARKAFESKPGRS